MVNLKTSIAHLPETKQTELNIITKLVTAKFPDVDRIILFGSFATGKWVEDEHIINGVTYEYQSDYDILIIIGSNEKAASETYTESITVAVDDLNFKTPASIIYHSIDFVNKKIHEGNYFFNEIRVQGILLYNSGKYNLANKGKLNSAEVKANAIRDFESWFGSANNFYTSFDHSYSLGHLKEAAFHLHQATERYYHTILLVFIGYKPKTHDIDKLGKKAIRFSPAFAEIFPRKTTEEKRLFLLLKKAYIDSRYDMDYVISKEDLHYLSERVKMLRDLTQEICTKRISSL